MNNAAIRPPDKLRADASVAGPFLRALLREGTSIAHQRLDLGFAGMTDADDVSQYHRFIRMNHACHARLEPLLERMADQASAPFLARRQSLLPALVADMRSMDLTPVDTGLLPVCRTGLPEAAGLIYVLDGSRLGARFIHRQFIGKDLGSRWPGASSAYLAGASGPDAFGDRMAALSDRVATTTARERALAAAQAAFALFESAYQRAATTPCPEPVPS
ncbi:MAG TPA: biliverdin-producing heme oxygenase [Aurantimonas sp.]|jgi:heme oxygenase|nr:biliverdin-producing heme oxygenase [Aurantimonas sp.]